MKIKTDYQEVVQFIEKEQQDLDDNVSLYVGTGVNQYDLPYYCLSARIWFGGHRASYERLFFISWYVAKQLEKNNIVKIRRPIPNKDISKIQKIWKKWQCKLKRLL